MWNIKGLDNKTKETKTSSDLAPITTSLKEDKNQKAVANTKHNRIYEFKNKIHQEILSKMNLAESELLDSKALQKLIKGLASSVIEQNDLALNSEEKDILISELQNEILGLGPLEPILADTSISEIMVNRFDQIYVERAGKLILTPYRFNDNEHLLKIIDKIVTRVGRRIDELNPMADARLPDGSRVNAVIPPIALDGAAMAIRLFSVIPFQMNDLIERNSVTPEIAEFISAAVKAKANIIISGGTGSGKTTLLNILSAYIPDDERIITIEDTAELQLQQPHVIRLESRPPNIEQRGEITIRSLVRNSLRMRPDRIVLGEVRGNEVIDMLQAMNTGHDGSLSTVHANSPRDALARLENLIGMGGVTNVAPKNIRQQIASAINLIIQIGRLSDGGRKVLSIHEITGMETDVISSQEIFKFNREGIDTEGKVMGSFIATGVRPMIAEKIKTFGIQLSDKIFEPNYILR